MKENLDVLNVWFIYHFINETETTSLWIYTIKMFVWQDMLYQWSMRINSDQFRSMTDQICGIDLKCISIKINADQWRSISINTSQYRSMPINASQCQSALTGIDRHWEVLRSIDFHWWTFIIIDQHLCQCHIFDPSLIGIDRHWSLIQHVLKLSAKFEFFSSTFRVELIVWVKLPHKVYQSSDHGKPGDLCDLYNPATFYQWLIWLSFFVFIWIWWWLHP